MFKHEPEVETVLRFWNLTQHGPELESLIVQNKRNEKLPAYYKINKLFPDGDRNVEPPYCFTIGRTDFEDEPSGTIDETHFQESLYCNITHQ